MNNSRHLSRRDFIKITGFAIAGTALSSCSSLFPKSNAQSGENTQLVYQDFNDIWFQPMARQQLEQFHTSYPDISVYYIPDPVNMVDQMTPDLQAGTAPDVFQGCCAHFPSWAQKGYTLDLRPYVEADLDQETIADWDPAQYRALFSRDGQQFGLPKYHGALALYYNKDLFDKYHVDYPDGSWNHDDYLHAMKLLTHDRNGDGKTDLWGSMVDIYWDRIQFHVNGWGGHFVDPADPTRCMMNEPEALAAVEWLRARMWDDRCMATLTDVDRMTTRQAFISEKIAMVEDGSWTLKDILSGAPFRIGVAPFPSGPVRKVTLATTDGFGIYAGTKYPEAAWELMKFLISKDYGRAMARADFLQPALASIVGDWIGYIQEQFPQQTKGVDLAAFAEGQLKGYSVVAEIFANMGDATRIAQDAWDQILTLGQKPTESMLAAAQQIQDAQK
ncbi:MAG: extracellular solute-binding protein [Anaerolineales bacterium]|nr:extracellular solute-binding protein [Anaerolineales bacterium]